MNDPIETSRTAPAVDGPAPTSHSRMKAAAVRVLSAAGFDSRMELRRCDVCGKYGRHVLCLEIERAANRHVLVNAARNISQGATHTSIACPDFRTQAAVCRLLDRELPPEVRHRVSVVTFSLIDFLGQLALSAPETISQHGAGDNKNKHEQ